MQKLGWECPPLEIVPSFAVQIGSCDAALAQLRERVDHSISRLSREESHLKGNPTRGVVAPWRLRTGPAPHSLRTANFGPVGPMCQSGGSCVCRAVLWLAIGLHTVKWTAEACLAAAGLMHCEFGCRLASYGAPTALEHFATGVCPVVSGVKMGPSAYTNDTVPSPGCVLQGLRLW